MKQTARAMCSKRTYKILTDIAYRERCGKIESGVVREYGVVEVRIVRLETVGLESGGTVKTAWKVSSIIALE